MLKFCGKLRESRVSGEDNTCAYGRHFVNILGAFNILIVGNTVSLGGSSDCVPQDLRQNRGTGTSSGYRVLSSKDRLVLHG